MLTAATVDEYIALFPTETQQLLQTIRSVIKQAAPKATEKISYGIPTFTLHGNLVHFGAYKNHIGFYPSPSGIQAFEQQLQPYHKAKGTLQFKLNEPLPIELIKQIVEYRIAENTRKASARTKKS